MQGRNLQSRTEKGLKAWLKKKKIGVTAALLTAFLITGNLLGANGAAKVDTAEMSEAFFEKLARLKADVEALLRENEANLSEKDHNIYELLLQGDYYAKPVYPSAQIFFDASLRNQGRMKDRTREAWAGDIELAREYLAAVSSTDMSWYDALREYAYKNGLVSGSETGREVLVDGNGTIAVGGAHEALVDLGMSIRVAKPAQVPDIVIPVQKPTVPASNPVISMPALTISGSPLSPAVTGVTPPSINLGIVSPQIATPAAVAPIIPTEPEEIQLTAPSVGVSVGPHSVTSVQRTSPLKPQTFSFHLQPAAPGPFSAPLTPDALAVPAAPSAPVITLPTPSVLNYDVGGMSQSSTVQMNDRTQGIALKNYQYYDTNGGTFEFNMTYVRGGLTPVSGTVRANPDGVSPWVTWTTPALTYMPNAFIADVLDLNVDIDGDYLMHVAGSTWYPIFINYSPYLVGSTSADDKTLDFKGTLTITGTAGAAMGHQLLAGGVYGTTAYPNVTGGLTTSIMKNSGTITLSGSELVGIFINTAYEFTSNPTTYFHKRPQTINGGTINISAGSTDCIAVDYGFYRVLNTTETSGPNNDLYLGDINIDGTNNIGYRQKDYGSQYGSYFNYYDLTRIYGSNGVIRVNGSRNTGIYIGMGVSTGNPVSNLNGLQILVGGTQNTGLAVHEIRNTSPAILGSSSVGTNFGFAAGATGGQLIYTNSREIILDTNLNLTTGGVQNALMTADGSAATVTLAAGATVTSTLPQFYGLVAKGSGANPTINHHGVLDFSGDNSVGLAVYSSVAIGNSDGDILMTGDGAKGIYSLGRLNVSGGNITVRGISDAGIFHASTVAGTIGNTNIASDGAKSVGIYNAGSGALTLTGGTVSAKGAIGLSNLGAGIYNAPGRTVNPTNVAFTADDYAAAVYNAGNMTISGGSIAIAGLKAIGVYEVGGTLTLAPSLNAAGTQSIALAYTGGTLNFAAGLAITASGTQSIGVYNTATLTMGPDITLSGDKSIGLYNSATGTLTSTGEITAAGAGLTRLAGIYNDGTLTSSTSDITIHQEASSGVYNKGIAGTIGGTVAVSGAAGGASSGVYNAAGSAISDVAGTVHAGNYAAALYNEGTAKVSGILNVNGNTQSTGIYNSGAGTFTQSASLAINVAGTAGIGVYNDATGNILLNDGLITVGGNASAGVLQAGSGAVTLGGNANISVSGTGSAGIVNTKKFILSGGAVTTVGNPTAAFYNAGAAAVLEIAPGNTGTLSTGGLNSAALYNDQGTVDIKGNATFTAKDGASGLYAAGGAITADPGAVLSINVNNALVAPAPGADQGVGVFAVNSGATGAQLSLRNAEIAVVGGSAAVASLGAGPGAGTTNIDLSGATIDYDGAGYALYSNGLYGKIDLANAQLNLRGKSTGIAIDFSAGTPTVNFNGTAIDVYSAGVTLAELKDIATPLYASSLVTGIAAALGAGVTITDHTGSAYTLARVDGGNIHIDADISRSDTTGPGAAYYRTFRAQRVKLTLDAGHTATAVLNTAGAADYDHQVIGLEGNSSANALLPTDTEIKIESGAKIIAARTDTTTDGAIGVYVNYGKLRNEGNIEVQQAYANVGKGVGIFAVNGSIVENAGTVKVAGEKAIGVLAESYRLSGGLNNVGAEFGAGAAAQGKISIDNSGTITLTEPASIGIYANNNSGDAALPTGTPAWTAADNIVRNTGGISVGNGNSPSDAAAGLYGSGVTLKNSGTITVGDYAIGIYGTDGAVIADVAGGSLGTIKIGGNSAAILGAGASIAASVTSLTLQSDNTTADKAGILYRGTPADIAFSIDGSAFAKGAVIVLEDPAANFAYGPGATLKVGPRGVGIYLSDSVAPGTSAAVNKGTIELSASSANATGLYTDRGIIENSGTVNLLGSAGQTGLYAKGSQAQLKNSGTITFSGSGGTGIYLEDGASLTGLGTLNFGTSSENTGIHLDGANLNVAGLTIATANADQNILVFAEDRPGTASTVQNNGTLTVNGLMAAASGSNKTVGVYLKRNSVQNIYNGGTITVQNGAIGLYAKGDNRLVNGLAEADGKESLGIYLDGPSTLDNMRVVAKGANAGESVVGLYAAGGAATIVTGLALETGTTGVSDYGTGMFLTGGASVIGADIHYVNRSTAVNAGLYYKGGSGTTAQGTDLILSGNDLVGIYVEGGMTLTNAHALTYSAGGKRTGAMVAGGSKYISTSTGDIIATPGSAAILAGDGNGVNRGTLTVADSSSAAMAAIAALTGQTAAVLNDAGALIRVNAGAGLVAGDLNGAGTSKVENKGNIQAAAGTAGVALRGANATFDGSGGTIDANGPSAVAIYLEETTGNSVVATGTLNLNAPGAVGIYAKSAEVPFDVTLGAGATQGIALLAAGTPTKPAKITGTVDASASTGTVGVFLADENVVFTGATVKAGDVGLYVSNMTNYTLSGVTVEAARVGATGLYTTATNLNYAATIRIANGGLGIYVPTGATLTTTGGGIIAADASSVGILLDGGAANIGVTGPFTLQLAGGVGVIVKNGGTLNVGSLLTVTGSGILAAVENTSFYNASVLNVTNAPAMLGSYTTAGPWTMENAAAGVIHASGGGLGVVALSGGGSPQVTILNHGLIEVTGKNASGQSSVGIYSDVAEIRNPGRIETGPDAIGIAARNTGKAVATRDIELSGQNATGLVASGATAGIINDNIRGTSEKTLGMALENLTGTVAAGLVDLADSSLGLYIAGGAPVLSGGSIKTGNTGIAASIGLYAGNGANVSMTTPLDITAGKGAFALIADGATVSGVDPAKLQAGADSVLLSAVNGGSIATVGSGILTASGNTGIYLKSGGSVTGLSRIDVTAGGLGAVMDGTTAALPTIRVGNGVPETAGASAKYSIGVYYSGVGGTITPPLIQQSGSWSVGLAFDKGITAALGNISVGAPGATRQIGVYAEGTAASPDTLTVGKITVTGGANTGLYTRHTTISANDVVADSEAAGIASLGRGDVTISGKAVVSSGTADKGGVALYRKGAAGTILTNPAGWVLGDYGYGIYAEQENEGGGDQLQIINHADMRLGTGAVGIYAKGLQTRVENHGVLSAGPTFLGPAGDHGDTAAHLNSAALYLTGGVKGINYGTIQSENEHSIAVYVEGPGTRFENAAGGVILADRGSTGILVKGDLTTSAATVAVNNGTITVGNHAGTCGAENMGMAAFAGATAINGAGGEIHVYNGVGLYAGNDSFIQNDGTIYVYTALGTAVAGTGNFVNNGRLILTAGVGKANGMGYNSIFHEGAVSITEKGIFINDQYITTGGVIEVRTPMILAGATVSPSALQTATRPLFTAPDISGTIRLTPDFVKIGNGWAFIVEGFDRAFSSTSLAKVTVETSPMYVAKEVGGKLYVAKRPYVEVMLPGLVKLDRKAQDLALYEGLDSLLYGDPEGQSKDALILKDMNAYLESVFVRQGNAAFLDETTRTISEIRGDIYGTIQKRMQDVEFAFDRSFAELLGSYNITKDSDKYSVIYQQGRFRDKTTGVDDYDYRVQGLLYMKEHEGRDYANKWGWTLGFAASRFDFDDAPTYHDKSKEDIYSLRLGWHRVKSLEADDSFRWVTRLGAGYNYHRATRSLELDRTVKNKGHYETWQLSWDNSLERSVYRSDKGRVDVYAAFKAEYGFFGRFHERGEGLELSVSRGYYVSLMPEVGIKASRRAYLGKKLSLKFEAALTGGIEYGNNYGSNRARLKNGSAGTYTLVHPEKERANIGASAGLTLGHTNNWDISLDLTARRQSNRDGFEVTGGLKFKFVLPPWGTQKWKEEE